MGRAGPSLLLKHQISLWGGWFRGDTATKAAHYTLGSVLNVLGHWLSLQLQNELFQSKVWGCQRAGGQPHTDHLLLWTGHPTVTEQAWGNCSCPDSQSKMACASSEALIIWAIIHLKFHLWDNEKANLRQMTKLCWFWNFTHTESYQCLHDLMCLVEEKSIFIYSLTFRFCLTATPTSQQTWEWFNLFYG